MNPIRWLSPSVLVVFALVPFIEVVWPLVHLLTGVTLPAVTALPRNPEVLSALATSLSAAVVTAAAAALFGIPAAFLLSLRDFPGKQWLTGLFVVPLVLPPVVGGIADLNLFGPETTIGQWFALHGIPLTDSLIGIIMAQSFVTSPYCILSAKAAFEGIPSDLKDATRLAGGTTWDLLWRVAIPLAQQAIWTGIVLTFARAIGEFGATVMVAYHPYTLPVDLWVQFSAGGLPQILPIAAGLVVLVFVVLAVWSVGTRITRRAGDR